MTTIMEVAGCRVQIDDRNIARVEEWSPVHRQFTRLTAWVLPWLCEQRELAYLDEDGEREEQLTETYYVLCAFWHAGALANRALLEHRVDQRYAAALASNDMTERELTGRWSR